MLSLIRKKIDAHNILADPTSPNIDSEKDVVHNPRQHNKYSLPRYDWHERWTHPPGQNTLRLSAEFYVKMAHRNVLMS